MPDIIALLPDHVANQIAAGEVIQRPASVVKELLENAIDAKAKNIQLIIKDAGKTIIQVIDDGVGMSSTDVRMAFERHATSKIKKANDLFSLSTKGFRGEALASIAAIAHVETHTRRSEDEMATCLKIEGSKVTHQDVSVAPKGTSIAVKNLFYNVTARRNFLKSNNVELRHIIDEFHRVALAHPDISFVFLQNGTELFSLPKAKLRTRIVNIFGGKTNEKLVPVKEETSVALIEGFVVKPEYARRNRGQQFFFVNQRFIKSPFLHHCITNAFEGLIPKGYHPGYFIYLQVDPKTIDINIHPTKTEIKFQEEQNLYALLRSAVKHGLGMFQVSPTLDFNRDASMDIPHGFKDKSPVLPTIEVDPNFNPFKNENPNSNQSNSKSWESLYSSLHTDPQSLGSETTPEQELLNIPESPKVFQLFSKFIVSSMRSHLLIINQNRAHQRVLYESFLKTISSQKKSTQKLLLPIPLVLEKEQIIVFQEAQEELEAMGFEMTLNKNKLTIVGTPKFCSEKDVQKIIEGVLAFETETTEADSFSVGDRLAKSMCQLLAIKTGTTLNVTEQKHLVDDLFGCKETMLSPFNRQIFITLEKREIEKRMN